MKLDDLFIKIDDQQVINNPDEYYRKYYIDGIPVNQIPSFSEYEVTDYRNVLSTLRLDYLIKKENQGYVLDLARPIFKDSVNRDGRYFKMYTNMFGMMLCSNNRHVYVITDHILNHPEYYKTLYFPSTTFSDCFSNEEFAFRDEPDEERDKVRSFLSRPGAYYDETKLTPEEQGMRNAHLLPFPDEVRNSIVNRWNIKYY
jgi:hypothetical protein